MIEVCVFSIIQATVGDVLIILANLVQTLH